MSAHTTLLVSKTRVPSISAHPDHYVLMPSDSGSISIKEARELKEWAQLKPFSSDTKRALIVDFHTATIEAQNALLKLFEEPPAYTNLYIHVDDTENILPTIVSRSEVMFEPESNSTLQSFIVWHMRHQISDIPHELTRYFEQLTGETTLAVLFDSAEQFSKKDRAELLNDIDLLLVYLSHNNHITNMKKVKVGTALLETKRLLSQNVNTRLALEHLAIASQK